ncbi:hypothetical protein HLB23_22485 [Nocardia uniformis]|uniref:Uncharacterized protein n=1 Tax=Nocardia uniformis TaxID=53432 RepID=A0A849C1U5_9NOCA|nr:hypothetical protein [Nocardia uniformis]NNH72594.1 hypothetical protein [Nocardia uniformis]
MKSTKLVSPRRKLARLAVAGAIAAIPLAALAVPASAEITLEPEVTEVAHPHHNNNNYPWNNNRYPWENRNSWDNRNHWNNDDCDRHGRGHHHDRNHDRNFPRNVLPRGSFGSS